MLLSYHSALEGLDSVSLTLKVDSGGYNMTDHRVMNLAMVIH